MQRSTSHATHTTGGIAHPDTMLHMIDGNNPLPTAMNNPFSYEPHPLCRMAAVKIRQEALSRSEWHEELTKGKMFGVLIVSDSRGNKGYLQAFSGQICGRSGDDGFVPAVFDYLQPDGYFKVHERMISDINARVRTLKAMKADGTISDDDAQLLTTLLRRRRTMSEQLQEWLFSNFIMVNMKGGSKPLTDIFMHYTHRTPPSGSGECCAPKLLQYAFLHDLQPLQIAEFWMGESPKGEHREDGMFYPACENKCRPILRYMLGDEITQSYRP